MENTLVQYSVWLIVMALIAFGAVFPSKVKQNAAVKELIGGIILGNLTLVGISFFEPLRESVLFNTFSEIAISYFLFRVGFSATIGEMRSIGFRALLVAIVGVLGTFLLGILFIPFIFSGVHDFVVVFIAAALTSTSVGITAGILQDLHHLETKGAKILLVAAVIDDIVSIILLAITVSVAYSGTADLSVINIQILRIVSFIVGGLVLGMIGARILPKLIHQIHPHVYAKYLGVTLFFVLFYLGSKMIGLSPEVGAFIGGLVLERRHFDHSKENIFHGKRVEAFFARTSAFVVPLFFIMTGVHVQLSQITTPTTAIAALLLFVLAVVGKLISGIVAGKRNEPWLIAIGMIPRGEFVLIFANVGLAAAIITPNIFSAITLTVMLTLLFAPRTLKWAIAQKGRTFPFFRK